MAIYRCFQCDELTDSDYDPPVEFRDFNCCEKCAALVICSSCDVHVDEGELSNDGECGNCAYATEKDQREAHADNQYTERKERELFGDD